MSSNTGVKRTVARGKSGGVLFVEVQQLTVVIVPLLTLEPGVGDKLLPLRLTAVS